MLHESQKKNLKLRQSWDLNSKFRNFYILLPQHKTQIIQLDSLQLQLSHAKPFGLDWSRNTQPLRQWPPAGICNKEWYPAPSKGCQMVPF